MRRLHTTVVAIYDLDLAGSLDEGTLRRVGRAPTAHELDRRYFESAGWLLELPGGFRRYCFQDGNGELGSSLLLHPQEGTGVYSVWRRFGPERDPMEVKHSQWGGSEADLERLHRLGVHESECDRIYPFTAIRVGDGDLVGLWQGEAEALGRIVTGGYGYDEAGTLRAAVAGNLSSRTYERLVLTWSDGLALYNEGADDKTVELTLCRAVQLCETCILIRRLLRSTKEEIDRVLPTITFWRPRPWTVNRIAERLAWIEHEFIASPDVSSPEAERLLSGAYRSFGISERLAGTKQSYSALEQRFQWAKTQLFAGVALLAYVLDKFRVFDVITPWSRR